jgi:hypothetical protein
MSRTLEIVPDCGDSHTGSDRKVVLKVGRGRRLIKKISWKIVAKDPDWNAVSMHAEVPKCSSKRRVEIEEVIES